MSTAFIWSIVFGIVGGGYFMYGKSTQKMIPLAAGIALCVYPYFVSGVYVTVGIGVTLMLLPLLIRR